MNNASIRQSAKDIKGPAPITTITGEPAPLLIVDLPLPEQLQYGRVVIQYRTENLRIIPVYGQGARNVSPRIGHLHVTVDDAPWHWLDASGEPLIIKGLLPGQHSVLIELADPEHNVIDFKKIAFVVPAL
ncbi:MAG: DUF6130 family protein [Chitinophagaceae bacterium]